MPTVVCCIVAALFEVFCLAVHVVHCNVVCSLDTGPQVTVRPAARITVTHLLANRDGRKIREQVVTHCTCLMKNSLRAMVI